MPKDIANSIVKGASRDLNALLDLVAEDIRLGVKSYGIKYKKPFWKNNKALYNSVQKAIKKLNAGNLEIIEANVRSAWGLANSEMDQVVIDYIKSKDATAILESKLYSNYTEKDILSTEIPVINDWINVANSKQLNAFINRSVDGLKLSGRVWKVSQKATQMIEQTLSSGILQGQSAASMSRILKQSLKNPNALFRKVKNPITGKLELSAPAKAFKSGQGVYKSAFQNAFRLARTETNMAYRFSEGERINQIPFVIGYDVHLSGSHPVVDICDSMVGRYPKTFTFLGWHPACICYSTTVMLSDTDFNKYLSTGKIPSNKYTQNIPKQAKTYIIDNKEKIDNLKSVPYWLSQNETLVNSQIK